MGLAPTNKAKPLRTGLVPSRGCGGPETCSASASVTVNDPCTVQYGGSASPPTGETILRWSWVLSDGTTSNIQNPLHTYSDEGPHNGHLKVLFSDFSSCEDDAPSTCQDPCGDGCFPPYVTVGVAGLPSGLNVPGGFSLVSEDFSPCPIEGWDPDTWQPGQDIVCTQGAFPMLLCCEHPRPFGQTERRASEHIAFTDLEGSWELAFVGYNAIVDMATYVLVFDGPERIACSFPGLFDKHGHIGGIYRTSRTRFGLRAFLGPCGGSSEPGGQTRYYATVELTGSASQGRPDWSGGDEPWDTGGSINPNFLIRGSVVIPEEDCLKDSVSSIPLILLPGEYSQFRIGQNNIHSFVDYGPYDCSRYPAHQPAGAPALSYPSISLSF